MFNQWLQVRSIKKVILFPDVYWPEWLGNEHLTVLSNIIEWIYAVLTYGLTKTYYISYVVEHSERFE